MVAGNHDDDQPDGPTMNSRRILALALLIVPLALACEADAPAFDAVAPASVVDESRGVMVAGGAIEPPAAPAPVVGFSTGKQSAPSQRIDTTGAMLIRTGSARLEVDSLDSAIAQVRGLAESLGGHVTSTAIQAGRERVREASLEIRVPAVRFDEAIGGLDPLGTVEAVHVSAQDVGEEVVDVEARLSSARQLEQRLLEILRTRTGKLDDVLAVERELARVRAEIEGYEGRLRYLRGRIALSTLTVSLHEPVALLAGEPGQSLIADAVKQAWYNFLGLLAGAIAALGFVVPLTVVGVVAFLVVRRLRGRASAAAGTPAPGAA
jgi:hypothetical protein